ncbi:MAG: hypothetical protein K5865_10490 [Eubacterium sp.]|nr:hypothetical protein [Eubacterium sp.]
MRRGLSLFIKILIVIFVVTGTVIMFNGMADETGLTASGIYNLKYFAVLSNLLCGIITFIDIIFMLTLGKNVHVRLRLISVSSVGLTFVIIAFFLQPMYTEMNMYQNGNLWFHLIVPVAAMVGFIFFDSKADKTNIKMPFRYTFVAAIPSLVYGFGYLINILLNGVGEWPDTNDWYGFLNWGYPVGICIFAVVVIINWIVAALLRVLYNRFEKMDYR